MMWGAIWQYILQNVLPPSAWTLIGLGLHWFSTRRKIDANHEDMKQHVTNAAGGSDGSHPDQ